MLYSALDSSSGGGCLSVGCNSSTVRYLPPYELKTYLQEYAAHFDIDRLVSLPSAGTTLIVPLGEGVRDTAAVLWRRCCKHSGGRGALRLRAGFQEMDSPFVRFQGEEYYRGRLTVLRDEVWCRLEVPSVVAVDPSALTQDLGQVYFVLNRAY